MPDTNRFLEQNAPAPSAQAAEVARSNRADVRNPLLSLPAARGLAALDAGQRQALRALLLDLRVQGHERAEASWTARKGPMAVYYRCVAVYAGHTARLLRDRQAGPSTPAVAAAARDPRRPAAALERAATPT